MAEIETLELLEAERRFRAVDRDGDQAVAVAAETGFIADPMRLRGTFRPYNDNDVALRQRLLHAVGIGRPPADQPIPPDREAPGFQDADERLRLLLVIAVVAEENGERVRLLGTELLFDTHAATPCHAH